MEVVALGYTDRLQGLLERNLQGKSRLRREA